MQLVERFAANLRRARLAKGLTQEGLAEASELHRTHISLLEKSKRDPKLTTIAKLAVGLDTTPGQLLRGIGTEGHEHQATHVITQPAAQSRPAQPSD